MEIQNVPTPQLGKGMLLIKNYYSVVSSGTEGATVKAARSSLIGKAQKRPQQAKQVIDSLRTHGPMKTYNSVMKKLDAYSPLGYSSSGIVVEVGDGVDNFKVGDYVACAGVGYANHAEIICVPKNLCVKLKPDTDLRSAAYNTLGAISMQAVRQAELHVGETCVIIGLGILGQLASSILRASGVTVIGIDISETAISAAKRNNVCDYYFVRSNQFLVDEVIELTAGLGSDAVIIAAATTSTDPINLAGSIARKRGKVIILGDVSTGFDRDPFWYKKELTLAMSCSYGPGRYDPVYEEKGVDYPAHYVRWTENRNMQAFQKLLSENKINIDSFTTHEYNFKDATKAYDLILTRKEPFLGIVFKYDVDQAFKREKVSIKSDKGCTKINLSFVGAGSYAQGNLLPYIPKNKFITRRGVLSNTGLTSKRVAEKYNFEFCSSDSQDVFNSDTNLVFVTTRHDTHADYVIRAMENNQNVFVEKPLCIIESDLDKISRLHSNSDGSIMVGYNRRFSPLTKIIKDKISVGPMSLLYRVNAGHIPKDHWIQDKGVGGGRLLGEVCHFIDYMVYITGSLPESISAQSLGNSNKSDDTINMNIQFKDGSIGSICYFTNGGKSMAKEYIEINSSNTGFVIDDFKELKIYSHSSVKKHKLKTQDKGQREMLKQYFSGLENGKNSLLNYEEIEVVMKTCFRAQDSIKSGGERILL